MLSTFRKIFYKTDEEVAQEKLELEKQQKAEQEKLELEKQQKTEQEKLELAKKQKEEEERLAKEKLELEKKQKEEATKKVLEAHQKKQTEILEARKAVTPTEEKAKKTETVKKQSKGTSNEEKVVFVKDDTSKITKELDQNLLKRLSQKHGKIEVPKTKEALALEQAQKDAAKKSEERKMHLKQIRATTLSMLNSKKKPTTTTSTQTEVNTSNVSSTPTSRI